MPKVRVDVSPVSLDPFHDLVPVGARSSVVIAVGVANVAAAVGRRVVAHSMRRKDSDFPGTQQSIISKYSRVLKYYLGTINWRFYVRYIPRPTLFGKEFVPRAWD